MSQSYCGPSPCEKNGHTWSEIFQYQKKIWWGSNYRSICINFRPTFLLELKIKVNFIQIAMRFPEKKSCNLFISNQKRGNFWANYGLTFNLHNLRSLYDRHCKAFGLWWWHILTHGCVVGHCIVVDGTFVAEISLVGVGICKNGWQICKERGGKRGHLFLCLRILTIATMATERLTLIA